MEGQPLQTSVHCSAKVAYSIVRYCSPLVLQFLGYTGKAKEYVTHTGHTKLFFGVQGKIGTHIDTKSNTRLVLDPMQEFRVRSAVAQLCTTIPPTVTTNAVQVHKISFLFPGV